MKSPRYWLCLPPVVLVLIDHLLTVFHQPAEYWQGDRGHTFEQNDIVNLAMNAHPMLFLLIPLVWMSLFTLLIVKLPRTLSVWLACAITIGHTLGSWSWVGLHLNFTLSLAVFLVPSFLISIGIKRSRETPMSSRKARIIGGLIAAVLASTLAAPWTAEETPRGCEIFIENNSDKKVWFVVTTKVAVYGRVFDPRTRTSLWSQGVPFTIRHWVVYPDDNHKKRTDGELDLKVEPGQTFLMTVDQNGNATAKLDEKPNKVYVPKW